MVWVILVLRVKSAMKFASLDHATDACKKRRDAALRRDSKVCSTQPHSEHRSNEYAGNYLSQRYGNLSHEYQELSTKLEALAAKVDQQGRLLRDAQNGTRENWTLYLLSLVQSLLPSEPRGSELMHGQIAPDDATGPWGHY